MTKALLPGGLLAAVLTVPFAGCAGGARFAGELEAPRMAPDIEGTDLDGQPFQLSDYRGKVVVLDFWGHW